MPVTVTETLAVNRIEVETDNPATSVTVADSTSIDRVAVTESGSDITVTLSGNAAGVASVNGLTGIVTLTTSNIAEGSNLYYTQERADSRVTAGITGKLNKAGDTMTGALILNADPSNNLGAATKQYVDSAVSSVEITTTDDLTEGTTNLYYTDGRADARVAVGIANLVDSAPGTLDTLNELAAALGDDANFSTTVTNSIATKLATADFTSTANTWLATKSTTNLTEGNNLYYTTTRFDDRLATKTTTNLTEGTNLYYTDQRARDAINGSSSTISPSRWDSPYTQNGSTRGYAAWAASGVSNFAVSNISSNNDTTTLSVNGFSTHTNPLQRWNDETNTVASMSTAGVLTAASLSLTTYPTTTNITEGTRLYYTDTRFDTRLAAKTTDNLTEGSTNKYFSTTLARGAVSAGTGVTYDSGTGVISIGQSVATSATPTFNNLTLTGGGITNTTTNGAVTLTANGTGDLAVVLSNGGNLTNTRNYVFGTVRDTTTDTNGDMWSFATGTTGYRGISIDNSTTTTKRTGIAMRSFSSGGGAVSPRMAILTEGSRGTPASPTAIQANDFFGEWLGTGRTSTGWVSDLVSSVAAGQVFYATENWTALTNTGSGWALALQPTATTLSGTSRITVIDATPQAINTRSDGFNIKSKANTNLVTIDSDGSLQVFNTNATNANNLYGYATKVLSTSTESGLGNNITIKPGKLAGSTTYDKQTELSVIQNTTDGTVFASYEMKTQRFGGTNFSATASGDCLGRLLFNGNYSTTTSPAVNQPGATVTAVATENWTSSAAGTKAFFTITKTGTNTNLTVAELGSASTIFQSDAYSFRDSSGTIYQDISNTRILNNRPHRSAITTHSMARGGTYTPAAGVNNFIEVTLTAGTDPTYIDVDNLTVAGEGGHQAILVYNNSGSSVGNNDLHIRNNGTTINAVQDTIPNGGRVIFTVYCIGNYASCEYMTAA